MNVNFSKMSYENNSAGKFFDLLPVEIQLNILEYVGIMNDCYLVCRKFQELCCLKRSDKFVLRLNTKMVNSRF